MATEMVVQATAGRPVVGPYRVVNGSRKGSSSNLGQPDGTILVKNKKTYLQDEKGNPIGAAWHDEWIAPDGKAVRKTDPSRSGRDL